MINSLAMMHLTKCIEFIFAFIFLEALKIACFLDAHFISKPCYSFHLISMFNFHLCVCVYDINNQKMEFQGLQ